MQASYVLAVVISAPFLETHGVNMEERQAAAEDPLFTFNQYLPRHVHVDGMV